MRKIVLSSFLVFLLAAATFGVIKIVLGQGTVGPNVINVETQGENSREILSPSKVDSPQQPNIGFIDSPSATCYQPNPLANQCFINWYYLSVSAAPNYMITMTLTLNATGPIAHTQGFFQTSMYVPYNMLGNGFQVKCGAAGAGGNPIVG